MCLILDCLYDVPCKIIHATSNSKKGNVQHGLGSHVDSLQSHFRDFGSPVMMGGDVDASSKGEILGYILHLVFHLDLNVITLRNIKCTKQIIFQEYLESQQHRITRRTF